VKVTLRQHKVNVLLGFLIGVLLLISASGCGQVSARDLRVDTDSARTSLQVFLETWKNGQDASALKQPPAAIHGTDDDWGRGFKLVEFRVLPDEFNDGANLHLKTELVLKEGRGRPRKSRVTYVVGTSPVVTVFRE
jgi:hypothetical protein